MSSELILNLYIKACKSHAHHEMFWTQILYCREVKQHYTWQQGPARLMLSDTCYRMVLKWTLKPRWDTLTHKLKF